MTRKMNISELRQNLPRVVKSLKENPEERIEVTVHGEPVVELKALSAKKPRKNTGAALLETILKPSDSIPSSKEPVSEHHDEFLY